MTARKTVNSKQLTVNSHSGFTLIELLIVIAVIGVLSVILLVSLNPLQQMAKTRDSGRKQSTTQLGHALEAYATTHNGVYVAEATWMTDLVNAGEIAKEVSGSNYSISGVTACTTNVTGNFCYDASDATGAAPVVVYVRLESKSEESKCSEANPVPWFVWSSDDGRSGLTCSDGTEPSAGAQTFVE